MISFKKILCPVDFNEPSYEALKAADELALHFSADLFLVHVIPSIPATTVPAPPPAATFNIPLYQEQLKGFYEGSLKEVIEKRVSRQLRVHPIIVQGDAADEILRIADQEKIDLIVMATHGRKGLQRFLFGSVAGKIVRLAPVHVLTVAPPLLTEKETEKNPSGQEHVSEPANENPEAKKSEREAYQEKIEAQLREWSAKIEELRDKAEKAKEEARVTYHEKIEELRGKQEAARQRLQELRDSGDDAWDKLKTGVERALRDFIDTFDRAFSNFRAKNHNDVTEP